MEHLSTKENAHRESCQLSFMWDSMRIVPWETAPQLALRNCSKEAGERESVCDFGKGGLHAIKYIVLWKISAGLLQLLLDVRNSHHHEEF